MLIEYRFEILLLQAIVCTLSVVSSSVIIFFYLYLKQLKQSFSFMVIFNIALTDFCLWGIRLIESVHGMVVSDTYTGVFCMILGYVQIALALSNFLWVSVMSYCIYSSIIHQRRDFLRQMKEFYSLCYFFPFCLSLVPFFTNNYGPTDDVKCWITGDLNGSLERLIMFYLPLLFVLFYSFWTVFKVWSSLKIPQDDIYRSREISRIRNQFLFFPLVLAICYIIPLVHRVLDFIDTDIGQTHVMLILHYISAPLQGFFNAVVYGTSNKDVRHKIKYVFCCLCCKKNLVDESRTISLLKGDEESSLRKREEDSSQKVDEETVQRDSGNINV